MNKRLELREKSLKQQPETDKGRITAWWGMVAVVLACTFLAHFFQTKTYALQNFVLLFIIIMIRKTIITFSHHDSDSHLSFGQLHPKFTLYHYLAFYFVVMVVSKSDFPST